MCLWALLGELGLKVARSAQCKDLDKGGGVLLMCITLHVQAWGHHLTVVFLTFSVRVEGERIGDAICSLLDMEWGWGADHKQHGILTLGNIGNLPFFGRPDIPLKFGELI